VAIWESIHRQLGGSAQAEEEQHHGNHAHHQPLLDGGFD
jgi:hypothetical protein